MQKEIGTVISSELGPNSREFWFVLNDNKGVPVRKGEFIQLNTQDGILVARVEDIIKTNRYYQRAESVSEFERSGKPLVEQFPVDRWEYLIAQAYPLGVFSNGTQKRVTFPPSPGNDVYPIDDQLLHNVLGLDVNSGLNIGKVEFHNVDAKLNLTRLFQKHLAVLAMSGAGKSYLTSVLIEELLNKERNTRPSIILIDPHGEYGGFAADSKYATSTKVYEGDKVTIATNSLSAYQLSVLQPKISTVQRRELNPVIRKLREEKPAYNMGDLIEAVLNSDIKDMKTKTVLASWLHELEYTGLFSNKDYPSIKDLAYQGNLSIFDLSNIVDIKRKQILVSYFAWKLFEARRQKKISPFVLFVEEAHQFAPQAEDELALSRGIIEQIAREGRKFNACLALITQRPAGLATTALSQCNTNIIMRVTNPYDLDHIKESSEGITGGVLDSIPGLKVGEAYIVGEAINVPILVNVRERKSKSSEKGMKLEDEIQNFNNNKQISDKDLETFM